MAIKTHSTVVAVFGSESDARAAIEDLKANGFDSNEIFLSGDESASGMSATGRSEGMDTVRHEEGGIKGWFKSVFGGEDEPERSYAEDRPYYENAVSSGNCVVSVDVDEQNIDTAADTLNRHQPVDVHREATGADAGSNVRRESGTSALAETRDNMQRGAETQDANSIPVVKEELQVGKRAVLRGGVRVYSRVVEEPVEESVRLREERVRVERTPVNRETTQTDLKPGQERVFEVKEYAEEPVISKSSRVVEEVRVRKDASERTETVRDTVRHTEVDVENLADAGVRAKSFDSVRAEGASTYPESAGDEDFRRDFNQRYASSGGSYDTYAPAYRYGYDMANDPRYRGRSFDEVESDLQSDYGRRYPGSTWEKMKDSVRYGWDKLTGKA